MGFRRQKYGQRADEYLMGHTPEGMHEQWRQEMDHKLNEWLHGSSDSEDESIEALPSHPPNSTMTPSALLKPPSSVAVFLSTLNQGLKNRDDLSPTTTAKSGHGGTSPHLFRKRNCDSISSSTTNDARSLCKRQNLGRSIYGTTSSRQTTCEGHLSKKYKPALPTPTRNILTHASFSTDANSDTILQQAATPPLSSCGIRESLRGNFGCTSIEREDVTSNDNLESISIEVVLRTGTRRKARRSSRFLPTADCPTR